MLLSVCQQLVVPDQRRLYKTAHLETVPRQDGGLGEGKVAKTLRWWVLVVADLVFVALGPLLVNLTKGDWPLQICAGVIAVLTFFLMWLNQHENVQSLSEQALNDVPPNPVRDAIAAAFVVTYLVMVVWRVFYRVASGQEAVKVDSLAQTFLSNFTFLTGVVVSFYFSAGAVERVAHIRSRPKTRDEPEANRDAASTSGGRDNGSEQ